MTPARLLACSRLVCCVYGKHYYAQFTVTNGYNLQSRLTPPPVIIATMVGFCSSPLSIVSANGRRIFPWRGQGTASPLVDPTRLTMSLMSASDPISDVLDNPESSKKCKSNLLWLFTMVAILNIPWTTSFVAEMRFALHSLDLQSSKHFSVGFGQRKFPKINFTSAWAERLTC